jgi:hypothetical protein
VNIRKQELESYVRSTKSQEAAKASELEFSVTLERGGRVVILHGAYDQVKEDKGGPVIVEMKRKLVFASVEENIQLRVMFRSFFRCFRVLFVLGFFFAGA